MRFFTNLFITISIILVAWLISMQASNFLNVTPETSMMMGFLFLLFGFVLFGMVGRWSDKRTFETKLVKLNGGFTSLNKKFSKLEVEFKTATSAFENEANKSKELLAEVKVLQTLLSQLAKVKGRKKTEDKTSADPTDTTLVVSNEIEPGLSNHDISEIMRNALKENRVDLYLQPIVGIPSRKQLHYECYSRVRDKEGKTIFAREYMPVAQESGLISTLDNLLLFRCTQLVRSLGHRQPDVRFFCNISTSSLHDEEFFPQFIDFMLTNKDLAERFVFEFAQRDILNMDDQVERNLLKLGQRGFRFSMDQVEDLNFDIPRLSQRFFSYVKIDADLLLGGKTDIHPQDFKEALSRYEMDLIASKVEDEQMVVNILDLNIDYGQGYLFGEPKIKSKKTESQEVNDFDDE